MTVIEAAKRYIERELSPVPIPYKSKAPVIKGWQKLRLTLADLPKHFNGHEQNIGIILGEASKGRTDTDLDCPEARALAKYFLPPTASVFGRESAPRSHWEYVVSPAMETQQWAEPFDKTLHTDNDKLMLVELRGTGSQTVFPPSVHPSGESIRFDEDGEAAVVEGAVLKRAVSRLAAASLLVRHWPPQGIRHDVCMALAGGLLRGGWTEEEVITFAHAILTVVKSQTLDTHLAAVRDTAKKLAADEPNVTGWPTLSELLGAQVVKAVREWCVGGGKSEVIVALRMTDVGNGERFAAQHHEVVRYCYRLKQWFVWNGQRWKADDGGRVMALAKQTARSLDAVILAEPDEAKRKALRKWATESERKHRLEAALFLAQSEPGMAIAVEALDKDPILLNVSNGTVDLRTGELREARRDDFITKLAPVEYTPEAVCPQFDQLLIRLFKNEDMRAYLQRIFGYSLTGLTNEQCFFIFYGIGNNGKSTILRAISDLLGDYATITSPATFLAKKYDEGIRNDVAALAGARLVTSMESEKGKVLAEGLIKGMTGDEKVSARFLHKEFFAFAPQFKLFIGTNHKPTIKGTDDGIWRRVRCVPFAEVIAKSERDRFYGEKLRAEFSGILNWLVQGCLAWQRDGLGEPPEVVEATAAYREEQDVLGAFLNDDTYCEVDPKATCLKKTLYDNYERWCEENGERYPLTKRLFGKALRELGYADTPGHHAKGWMGVRSKAVF